MINLELLTSETEKLVKNKKGYRYENLYGEGYRDIKDVCIHETFELGNSDIASTILTLYQDLLTKSEAHLLDEIANCIAIDELEISTFGNICENVAKKATGESEIKCIWLCGRKNDVRGYLMEGEELEDEDIDEYILPDNICILSDIGNEGALVAYKF